MRHVSFERHVPHPPESMFDLVADLEAYPRFIPNCTGMEVRPDGRGKGRLARMSIGFGPISQAYTSLVEETRPTTIRARAVDGPFSHLDSTWTFTPEGSGTLVRFEIDFDIRNPLLKAVAEPAFAAKQQEIVDAFMSEAQRRFGNVS
jgi:coenzyme Q-binding protein COQ10